MSFESFRALKLSKSESCRALKLSLFKSFRGQNFRAIKLLTFEDFRALKLTRIESYRALKSLFSTSFWAYISILKAFGTTAFFSLLFEAFFNSLWNSWNKFLLINSSFSQNFFVSYQVFICKAMIRNKVNEPSRNCNFL